MSDDSCGRDVAPDRGLAAGQPLGAGRTMTARCKRQLRPERRRPRGPSGPSAPAPGWPSGGHPGPRTFPFCRRAPAGAARQRDQPNPEAAVNSQDAVQSAVETASRGHVPLSPPAAWRRPCTAWHDMARPPGHHAARPVTEGRHMTARNRSSRAVSRAMAMTSSTRRAPPQPSPNHRGPTSLSASTGLPLPSRRGWSTNADRWPTRVGDVLPCCISSCQQGNPPTWARPGWGLP